MCYYICCKSYLTLNIVTTVKSYDEWLQKVKIDHCVCKIGLLKIKIKSKTTLNAIIALRTLCARRENDVCAPWARRVRAVNTLQQLLARSENVMDVVKTLWERRVDAVGTLWGRCVYAITGKFDILGVFCGDTTARWHGFRTLYKRCGNAVWCDRGLSFAKMKQVVPSNCSITAIKMLFITGCHWIFVK